MGELFTSFEEAWSSFLAREEPLENFYEQFPEDQDVVLEGWVIEPSAQVKEAATHLQAAMSHLDWLVSVPDHFLHVWIGSVERIDDAWRQWPEIETFPAAYRRVNCFHAAVVVEVEGCLRPLVTGTPNDIPALLPHMTVAITKEAGPAAELRDALLPLRNTNLGAETIREVKRVRFPAARSSLLRPWTVEQVVPLA